MKLDATTQAAMLDALEVSIGTSPVLELRTGAAAAALTGEGSQGTLVCSMALPSDWLANASGPTKSKQGSWSGTASAAGQNTVGHYAIKDSGGAYRQSGPVSFTATNWAASTSYGAGQKVNANGNTYNCTAAGTSAAAPATGPSGTGASISDGSVTWAYVSPAGEVTLDNTSVAQNQVVTVTSYIVTANNS